jgi:hypothetical protein
MTSVQSPLRLRFAALAATCLGLIWSAIAYEVHNDHDEILREAEIRTASSSQVFAEYTESIIRRLDELLIDMRASWSGDEARLSEQFHRKVKLSSDIAFQVGIIDKSGHLINSSMKRLTTPVDLSERLHFTIHRDNPTDDKLYISAPVLGKITGKWTIQLTRPIFKSGHFDGVIVLSINPELFSKFATKLGVQESGFIGLVRTTGELMSRQPAPAKGYGPNHHRS